MTSRRDERRGRSGPLARRRARRRLIETARTLAARRLVTGTTGNVSVRAGDAVMITPSRAAYGRLRPRDLVTVGSDGEPRSGGAPSQELPLHLAVYDRRPDVAAIIHTHSPYATAWSFLDEPLAPATEEISYYGIGEIRTALPAPAGSAELAAQAATALGASAAVLLGRHGVLVAAEGLEPALAIADAVEHQAHVAWLLRSGTLGSADEPWLTDRRERAEHP